MLKENGVAHVDRQFGGGKKVVAESNGVLGGLGRNTGQHETADGTEKNARKVFHNLHGTASYGGNGRQQAPIRKRRLVANRQRENTLEGKRLSWVWLGEGPEIQAARLWGAAGRKA